MNIALLTQLKLIKLSKLKPNFSELSKLYKIDRRTVKNTMKATQENLLIETSVVSWISTSK